MISIHLLPLGPGCRGSSLNSDAQASLCPDMSSWVPEVLPGQLSDIVMPECPGSSSETAAGGTCPEHNEEGVQGADSFAF